MPFGVEFRMELQGERQLRNKLRQLPPKMRRRAMVKGLSAAGGLLRNEVRTASPAETGLLRRSFRVKRQKARRGIIAYRVLAKSQKTAFRRTRTGRLRGVSAKRRQAALDAGESLVYRNPARYAHLVELGHQIVRGGRSVGFIPPTRFMSKAYDRKERAAINAVIRKVNEELQKAL